MRAYYFGNMYLSSIQQAVQALHVTSEMFVKYSDCPVGDKNKMLFDWAHDHKTVVLLNAGYSFTIADLVDFFDDDENPYPWVEFHESEEALNGALTCVGTILPKKIYEIAKIIRSSASDKDILGAIQQTGSYVTYDSALMTPAPEINIFTKWEFEMLKTLNKFGLAK